MKMQIIFLFVVNPASQMPKSLLISCEHQPFWGTFFNVRRFSS